ncbi:hypothetical protein E4U28_000401 [Claviceps purpurea]|nr:hypothetical protein E4U28_000401 [Claviceps purpurea]
MLARARCRQPRPLKDDNTFRNRNTTAEVKFRLLQGIVSAHFLYSSLPLRSRSIPIVNKPGLLPESSPEPSYRGPDGLQATFAYVDDSIESQIPWTHQKETLFVPREQSTSILPIESKILPPYLKQALPVPSTTPHSRHVHKHAPALRSSSEAVSTYPQEAASAHSTSLGAVPADPSI